MSKIQKVRQWLLIGKCLTVRDSVKMFGYYRLSAGISKLRKGGMNIETLRVPTKDGTTYAIYYMEGEK